MYSKVLNMSPLENVQKSSASANLMLNALKNINAMEDNNLKISIQHKISDFPSLHNNISKDLLSPIKMSESNSKLDCCKNYTSLHENCQHVRKLPSLSSIPRCSLICDKFNINLNSSSFDNINSDVMTTHSENVEFDSNASKCDDIRPDLDMVIFREDKLDLNLSNCKNVMPDACLLTDESFAVHKPSDNVSGSNIINDNPKKVIVQTLPVLELNKLSALKRCILVKIAKKSPFTSKTVLENFTVSLESDLESETISDINDSSSPVKDNSLFSFSDDSLHDSSSFSEYNFIRTPRRKKLHFSDRNGRGINLKNIDKVSNSIATASPTLLRILHYILYDVYGRIGSDALLGITKENILEFNGFLFDQKSCMYDKKQKCLSRVPFPVLIGIYNILIGGMQNTRSEMVQDILKFLLKPSNAELMILNSNIYSLCSSTKISQLTDASLKGPQPSVSVEKIATKDIIDQLNKISSAKASQLGPQPIVLVEKLTNQNVARHMKKHISELSIASTSVYAKPSYVKVGSGVKLKYLPNVEQNILKCRKRLVNILHSILFGRTGGDDFQKCNILEFNGFLPQQKIDFARSRMLLKKLNSFDVLQLCELFSLPVEYDHKIKNINKLLFFLKSPSSSCRKKKPKYCLPMEKLNESKKSSKTTTKVTHIPKCDYPIKPTVKLRDFENICFNIECAIPEDLTELNDLLYVKPCDNSDIHQKILDFTSFTFEENSQEYHFRRTLLHYMSFDSVRKIAELLDVPHSAECTNGRDMAVKILKFLMNMDNQKNEIQLQRK